MHTPNNIASPIIRTSRTDLVMLSAEDAPLIRDYYQLNQAHLSPWEPIRDDSFYSLEHWRQQLADNAIQYQNGSALKLVALDKHTKEIIAICNFTNIVRGIFQACNLGYSVSARYQAQGYMHEVLSAALDYVFNELDLHRVMANYMTHNQRSARLLKRLGFEEEGLAKSYLHIAGNWQDHVLTAKINDAH
ncbi:ribosomal protein S5-alanine N-acetyltransferase [Shewanella sp.]|nr:ribosomal protein S5-alanine N-acetyltransferase [Shewanella sp.]